MYRNILVAVDGSPVSALALKKAIELARITHARLCLFHALDELSISTALDPSRSYVGGWRAALVKQGEALLAEAAAAARQAGLEVETSLRDGFSGPVHVEIAEKAKAWGADLIVAGTHGRRGIHRLLLGSCAEQILRHAPVPVLLFRMPASSGGTQAAASSSVHTRPCATESNTPVDQRA
jgi:nucleotide-binding universal stress UspA family protein